MLGRGKGGVGIFGFWKEKTASLVPLVLGRDGFLQKDGVCNDDNFITIIFTKRLVTNLFFFSFFSE